MIIFLKDKLLLKNIRFFQQFLINKNIETTEVSWKKQHIFIVKGRLGGFMKREIQNHKWVEKILEIDRPYKLASRVFNMNSTKIRLANISIGNKEIVFMAGPCSIETRDQIRNIAHEVKSAGCQILRGGAFKPRTGPYDFPGLGKIGLHFLREAASEFGLAIITEIMDVRDTEIINNYTDIFQIGARNMQNYPLLKELGRVKKPVLLKRGMWATYKELLLAAEYILIGGNNKVILCERGIRTHVSETRFTLDLNIIPYLKHETHLPVIVDPSHGTGRADMVRAMSRAAIAAGADGLLIETHIDPRKSMSDAEQTISTIELKKLVREVKKLSLAVNRE
ncbi:3-deoxy-7-phosphoheptulonate synthase [Candidatus Gottesmanbacteria bacterium]|nr:3-deoxy-7-phosphoheptulonate synthase [Candidatus Gottesmanbacteria bacterium]